MNLLCGQMIIYTQHHVINDIIFISDKLRSGSGILVAASSVLLIYVLLLICLVDCVTYSYIGLGLAGAEFSRFGGLRILSALWFGSCLFSFLNFIV